MKEKAMLRFKDIHKSFDENEVLSGVSFDVMPGEIVSIAGENGAGKSTLMNILFGMKVIGTTGGFSGEIELDGEKINITNPLEALNHGIGMVHQEFMLLPTYTVAQNIKLNREALTPTLLGKLLGDSFDTINYGQMRTDASAALSKLGLDINPDTKAKDLPVGHKQFVEIAREIDKSQLKVLVFDEPTAVLTEDEAEKMLKAVRQIASEGISVIFISHRLDEIIQLANRIVILRDGKLIKDLLTSETDKYEVAELMVGRSFETVSRKQNRALQDNENILEFVNLKVDMPGERLSECSLSVRKGEIFGIGGLSGHGKLAISNAVAGMYPSKGKVIYKGKELKINKLGEAVKNGIAFVSEDRRGVGLLLDRSILENIAFTKMYVKKNYLKKFGFFTQLDEKAEREVANQMIETLAIKCVSPKQCVAALSGGNQQKVCVARAIIMDPELLFVAEPTRGIDVGAKQLLLAYLKKINEEDGITIVMVSSELNELRSACDRIAIIAAGKLQGILEPEASNVDFALLMSGENAFLNDKENLQ